MTSGTPRHLEPAPARFRVAIIARPSLYRRVIEHVLRDHDRFEDPVLARTPEALLALVRGAPPHLVVIETSAELGDPNYAAILEAWPEVPSVLMEGPPSLQQLDRLYQRGVRGVLSPRMTTMEVEVVLTLAVSGHGFVPRHLLDRVTDESPSASHVNPGPLESLTPREAEVLHLMARGSSNKAIAKELGITVSTVKAHVHAILRKLGVERRGQAAAIYHLHRGD